MITHQGHPLRRRREKAYTSGQIPSKYNFISALQQYIFSLYSNNRAALSPPFGSHRTGNRYSRGMPETLCTLLETWR